MKKVTFLPIALLFVTMVQAQGQMNSDNTTDLNYAIQVVHTVNQSLTEAYVKEADQKDIDIFYAADFTLQGKNRGEKSSHQQMDSKMREMVQNGQLSLQSIRQDEVQIMINENTAIVNGTWRRLPEPNSSTNFETQVPYIFTYKRQDGVWKMASAKFLPQVKPMVANKLSKAKISR